MNDIMPSYFFTENSNPRNSEREEGTTKDMREILRTVCWCRQTYITAPVVEVNLSKFGTTGKAVVYQRAYIKGV